MINPPTSRYRFAFDAAPASAQVIRHEVQLGATAGWTSIGMATSVNMTDLVDGDYVYGYRYVNATGPGPAGFVEFTVSTPATELPLPPAPTGGRIELIPTTPPDPQPGLGVIVRMNCNGGVAWPNCGANRTVGNDVLGTKWQRTYIVEEDAVEIHMMPGSTGEGYYGWQWTGLPNPGPGGRRVFRARIKVVGPVQWGQWGDKFYIFGDVANDSSNRVIGTMSLNNGVPHLNVDKNIDGRYAFVNLTPDRYDAVQMVVEPTTPGGSTYLFKYYLNGVLTSTNSTPFTINPQRWTDFNIGYYGQYGSSGHVRVRFKDVEFADTYDPNFR